MAEWHFVKIYNGNLNLNSRQITIDTPLNPVYIFNTSAFEILLDLKSVFILDSHNTLHSRTLLEAV